MGLFGKKCNLNKTDREIRQSAMRLPVAFGGQLPVSHSTMTTLRIANTRRCAMPLLQAPAPLSIHKALAPSSRSLHAGQLVISILLTKSSQVPVARLASAALQWQYLANLPPREGLAGESN
jgi:hypothetical protein